MNVLGLSKLIKESSLNPDQQEVADTIGFDKYCLLIDTFGGSPIWIPKARSLVPAKDISEYIRDRQQNGGTSEQISIELEMSTSEVRRFLK